MRDRLIEHRFFNVLNNTVEVLSMSVKRVSAIITVILSILLFVAAVAPSFSAEFKNIPVAGHGDYGGPGSN